MGEIVHVVIADDTHVGRTGVRWLLDAYDDIEVVGIACTPTEAVQLTLELRPEVLILDLKWRGDLTAGEDIARRILDRWPEASILAYTAHESLIEGAKAVGVSEAIRDGFTPDELVESIRHLAKELPQHHPLSTPQSHQAITPALLAANILIPIVGVAAIVAIMTWAATLLNTPALVAVGVFSVLMFFVVILFAGRALELIGETEVYKLFSQVLRILEGIARGFSVSDEGTDTD